MDLTKEQYMRLRASARKNGIWERLLNEWARQQRAKKDSNTRKWIVDSTINYRAELWDDITTHARNGRVGVIVSGMDCDCSSYYREFEMDMPVGAWLHQREVICHEAWLDGPESTNYCDPQMIEPQSRSRDLALEAFEDGHPHVVYA